MSSIGDRIKKIRKDNKLSQTVFSNAIGLSQGRLSEIEKGKNKPSYDTLYSIKDNYNISLDWLIFGEEYSLTDKLFENEDEQFVIETYRYLSEYNRTLIKGMLELKLHEQQKQENLYILDPEDDTKVIKEETPQFVPELGRVAAGEGVAEINLMSEDDLVQITGFKNVDFALRIVGDSMEPKIPDGSTVLIHKQPEVECGEIGIVSIDGYVTCKRIYKDGQPNGHIRLKSINQKYPDRILTEKDGEIHVLGKVILDENGNSK